MTPWPNRSWVLTVSIASPSRWARSCLTRKAGVVAEQGLSRGGRLLTWLATGEISEDLGLVVPGHEGLEHGPGQRRRADAVATEVGLTPGRTGHFDAAGRPPAHGRLRRYPLCTYVSCQKPCCWWGALVGKLLSAWSTTLCPQMPSKSRPTSKAWLLLGASPVGKPYAAGPHLSGKTLNLRLDAIWISSCYLCEPLVIAP